MTLSKKFPFILLGVAVFLMSVPFHVCAMKKTTIITEEWEFPPNKGQQISIKQSPEELINKKYRIQLFSLLKTEGKSKAHSRLEEMRKQAPDIANYLALLVTEKGSKWIRGQIGPFENKEEATSTQTQLRKILTSDQPTVSIPGVIHQPGFALEDIEWHTWQ